jgi:antagonist of KipI
VAVTGATFDLALDGQPVPCDTALAVRPGSVLRFGARRRGGRAYLAVAGGIDTPPVLGSRATHVPTATGGLDGRALRRGDRVPLGSASAAARPPRFRPEVVEHNDLVPVVRVLPGPDLECFARDVLDVLVAAPYHVSVQSDRMGFRLGGAALPVLPGQADIISDAVPVGTMQVPASGQPLVLMADRQTAGGYARLATVISADIGLLGQACPGDRIRFAICSRSEAMAAVIARERSLLAIEREDA